ncbi:MAG: FtsX-like permease family protein [Bacilli bacterium]|nr:FtsX-like permease family protein [Bacilli bacterium]
MLRRKMMRDIKNNLSQFITIFLMVMIGVMAYSGIESYMDGMKSSANTYYKDNNLQDLNVVGNNFKDQDLEAIKNIKHVKNAERKLSVKGTTNRDKTLLLNFIESNEIAKFYVFEGEEFSVDKKGVWIDNKYAEKRNIKVGDTILVKYDNLEINEPVVGIVNVPDHVYDTRDDSEIFPNRREFGIAYLSINEIGEKFIKKQAMKERHISSEIIFDFYVPDFNYKDYIVFNTIMVDVDKKSNVDKVKNEIDEKLEAAILTTKIEDSASYVAYQSEIEEGNAYVGVFSFLFLFIAVISVITTMTRVVRKQRVQIGTLKALGFSNKKVLYHYVGYALWVSVIGAILGLILGYNFLAKTFINLEMILFEVPNAHPVMNNTSYLIALGTVGVIILITLITCRKILKENPAETLRNEIPNVNKKTLDITTKGFISKLGFSTKWNIRDMLRNKMRTFMGIVGVTGCCFLIVISLGMMDSINKYIDLQFNELLNFKYKLVITEGTSIDTINELIDRYGSKHSKSYGIEIKNGDNLEANNLFVQDAEDFVRFINDKDEFIKIDSLDGVYVTYKLAEVKGYKLGDEISWHICGDDKFYTSKIVGFNRDPQNQNMSMSRKYLETLGIDYKPDAIYTNEDLRLTKEIAHVDKIQKKDDLKTGLMSMMSMMRTMIGFIIFFAVVLGIVIIYNLGILSYSEKEYQFATLKVLGFKDSKIKNIFVKQNNIITIISIIIGLPLGYYITDYIFKVAIGDHYDFKAYITNGSYILAAIGTFLTSYLVSRKIAKRIKDIDMVSSLKGNE